MAFSVRRAEYYYASVPDDIGVAYRILSHLADRGVNLLAFTAVPVGPTLAQFTLFPEDSKKLAAEANLAGLTLDGPHHALLVQGTTNSARSRAFTSALHSRTWISTRPPV
jgi:hypothetical protein